MITLDVRLFGRRLYLSLAAEEKPKEAKPAEQPPTQLATPIRSAPVS